MSERDVLDDLIATEDYLADDGGANESSPQDNGSHTPIVDGETLYDAIRNPLCACRHPHCACCIPLQHAQCERRS